MALIDYTYFQQGAVAVPNLADEVIADLNYYIQKYEPIYLAKVLGVAFRDAFLAGLEADPVEQKWKQLKEGATYQNGNQEWIGFTNDSKQSPIANYVYIKFARDNQTLFTGIGEVAPAAENATAKLARRRFADVWTEMAYWNVDLYNYLVKSSGMYPEFNAGMVDGLFYLPDNLMDV